MEVAIAGGHGKIARLLGRQLAAEDHDVRGLIRNPDHERDLHADGIEPVLCDLENADPREVIAAVSGAEAVIFAAGAGPGSGAERKQSMDLGGAVKLIAAAQADGIRRYLMVSSIGAAHPPPPGEGEVFGEYLRAKAGADRALAESGLEYTIVRPGPLTDGPPTGRVQLGAELGRREIPRADVAAILHACLFQPHTVDWTFDAIGGEHPIDEALAAL
ncbi:MAG: SDR family oxidoreductase [Actinobacteria bacterium]|nr:SDR family oxidoreductase [Actinomycetota bacterium]